MHSRTTTRTLDSVTTDASTTPSLSDVHSATKSSSLPSPSDRPIFSPAARAVATASAPVIASNATRRSRR